MAFALAVNDLYGATNSGNAWLVTFDLAGGYEFSIENIDEDGDGNADFGYGFSYRQRQSQAKGLIGPFLAVPGNATGAPFPASLGVEDALDWFSTLDDTTLERSGFVGTYAGSDGNYASFFMELYGDPRACRPHCPADFNGDGFLDFFDFDDFVICFEGGPCPPGQDADFNNDGFADFFDYDAYVVAFEAGC